MNINERERYEALERDWNRMRDAEQTRRKVDKWAWRLVPFVLVVILLVACDTPADRCLRWDAMVKGYDACAAAPSCQMHRHNYVNLETARIERAKWCAP